MCRDNIYARWIDIHKNMIFVVVSMFERSTSRTHSHWTKIRGSEMKTNQKIIIIALWFLLLLSWLFYILFIHLILCIDTLHYCHFRSSNIVYTYDIFLSAPHSRAAQCIVVFIQCVIDNWVYTNLKHHKLESYANI